MTDRITNSPETPREREPVGGPQPDSTSTGKPKRKAITDSMKMAVLREADVTVRCEGPCRENVPLSQVQFDHYQALCDGGEHSVANLRPVCSDCHKPKSAFEHSRNSKSKRLEKALEVHRAVLAGETTREPSRLKGRGFPKVHRPMRRPQP